MKNTNFSLILCLIVTLLFFNQGVYSENKIFAVRLYSKKMDNNKECVIKNPYSRGSGHYAGYEWAMTKNATSCGGNSDSFIEGCEKYLMQKVKCSQKY